MRTWTLLLVALAVVAAGCGEDGSPVASRDGGASPSAAPAAQSRYTATTTVLESPDHGPQLCLGGVEESYPPQCGGPEVIGWDWGAVDGEESASGTTWGSYTVVGAWDGAALTLTETPSTPERADHARPDGERFATPCRAPEGGWQVVDEATATDAAMNEAIAYARAQPDVGGVWVDQSINPAAQQEEIAERAMNDPTKLVLNLSFTGDLERHEARVREVWGGALCVSRAPAAAAELERIREQVEREVGEFLWSSSDEVRGRIEIGVTVDDGLQQQIDERYGPDIVEVHPALERVGDSTKQ